MPFSRVAVLVVAVMLPLPALLVIVAHSWRGRGGSDTRSVTFCEALADELRSGSSMRAALGGAASSVGEDDLAVLAETGPIDVIARAAGSIFEEIGPELGACVERSASTGAPAADLFDELAGLALTQAELDREVRSAMAPARVTALVMLAGPVVAVWLGISNGQLAEFLRTGPQRLVVAAGLALVLGSLVVSGFLIRRTR